MSVALQTRNTPSSDCSVVEPDLQVLIALFPAPEDGGFTVNIININKKIFLRKVAEFARNLAEVSVVALSEVLGRIHQVSGLVDGGPREEGGDLC